MGLPTKFWAEMAWTDFRDAAADRIIAVMPVAAIEQHGPHLPVGVDTFIMEGYLRRAADRVPAELPVLFLPVQAVAKSNEHVEFPGTLTLSADTVIRAWIEIGESVHRAGVRKLVIVNSHGGNIPPLDIVARELRVRLGMLAVVVSWSRFGYPDGLYGPGERVHGIHGGEAETSLMMAFRPELGRHRAGFHLAPRHAADRLRLDGTGRVRGRRHGQCRGRGAREGRGLGRLRRHGLRRTAAGRGCFRHRPARTGTAQDGRVRPRPGPLGPVT
jgi:creatinine amidohydrolase